MPDNMGQHLKMDTFLVLDQLVLCRGHWSHSKPFSQLMEICNNYILVPCACTYHMGDIRSP